MAYGSFYENLDLQFRLSCHKPSSLAIGHFFRFIYQHLTIFIGYPFRLVSLAVEIHYHGMTQGFDFARFRVAQALLHLETGVTYLDDATFADNRVVEMHRHTEIKVNVDKDILESQPVDFSLENMLEIAASTHVEVVALRPVVDMIVGVKVAHTDLDGTGKHIDYQIIVRY